MLFSARHCIRFGEFEWGSGGGGVIGIRMAIKKTDIGLPGGACNAGGTSGMNVERTRGQQYKLRGYSLETTH